MYHFTALVTCLAIAFYFFTTTRVAKARAAFGVKAPAISGDPGFERVFRVQMNTLEWMPIFLPSLWLFAIYISDPLAAVIGLVWIAGRILYMTGYSQAAEKRSRGFGIRASATDMIGTQGARAVAFKADVTNNSDLKAMAADALARWGRIDILHNNVGVSLAGGDAELLDFTEEALERCVAINLKSCIFAAKHVIPIMRQQMSGAIINISSMAAITTYPYVAYKATKAAMIAFTEQLAYQNAQYGIRANVILPGLMNTPMAVDTRAREFRKSRAEVEAERDAKVPLRKKMGTAWDVANAALFLASDEANFITGVTLPVDGGASVRRG